MDDCTCNTDGICWYHQCSCAPARDPDCHYHNELERVGADGAMEYGDKTIRAG
jgi:hypothetical protein